jgi:hypothetical protein
LLVCLRVMFPVSWFRHDFLANGLRKGVVLIVRWFSMGRCALPHTTTYVRCRTDRNVEVVQSDNKSLGALQGMSPVLRRIDSPSRSGRHRKVSHPTNAGSWFSLQPGNPTTKRCIPCFIRLQSF